MAFDPVWQFVSAILVAFAILGVGWRAAGLVRLRNSADMAVGIFAVLIVSVLAYWALGHGLQFGTDAAGVIGTTAFLPSLEGGGADGATLTRHALLSAFVAIVVASAAGERLRFPAAIALGVFAGAVLQPIAGHWIGAGRADGTTVVNDTSKPTTLSYSHTWTVDNAGTCQTFDNTATLTPGTGDSAQVEICRGADLVVTKTAAGSLTRTYAWSIDKTVGTFDGNVPAGTSVEIPYTVSVNGAGHTDSAWQVAGTITVTNPNARQPVTLLSLIHI